MTDEAKEELLPHEVAGLGPKPSDDEEDLGGDEVEAQDEEGEEVAAEASEEAVEDDCEPPTKEAWEALEAEKDRQHRAQKHFYEELKAQKETAKRTDALLLALQNAATPQPQVDQPPDPELDPGAAAVYNEAKRTREAVENFQIQQQEKEYWDQVSHVENQIVQAVTADREVAFAADESFKEEFAAAQDWYLGGVERSVRALGGTNEQVAQAMDQLEQRLALEATQAGAPNVTQYVYNKMRSEAGVERFHQSNGGPPKPKRSQRVQKLKDESASLSAATTGTVIPETINLSYLNTLDAPEYNRVVTQLSKRLGIAPGKVLPWMEEHGGLDLEDRA